MTSPDGNYRYVSPPNWPAPPEGWVPPEGWRPDPSWGPPPKGWEFWQPLKRAPAPGAQGGLVTAQGHNGQVAFDGDFVTIFRKGGLARMTVGKGDKRIPLSSVAAVQLKPAGAMVNGFIAFTVPGGNEGRSKFGSQTFDAAKDENSVVFRKSQEPAFRALREAVEQAIVQRHRPQQVVVQAAAPDVADQLTRLAALRDQGILSDDEFAAQKAKLLAG